jgi:Asp-tRNA(Asn)/Glu-tRNA(Gln) amidotransferase A subunit family amidase
VVPLSFTLDHAGPLTRTVEDCALAMQVLAGYDPGDPGSAREAVPDYSADLRKGVAGLTIGRARAYDTEAGVDAEVMAAVDAAAEQWRALGAKIVDVVLPSKQRMDACIQTILLAEGFAIHGEWLRTRPQDLAELIAVQNDILERARELVRPGGRLVYATCSVLPAENEERMESFLASNPDFAPMALEALWPALRPGVEQPCSGPWLRLSPGAHGTDGFFCAVLERKP